MKTHLEKLKEKSGSGSYNDRLLIKVCKANLKDIDALKKVRFMKENIKAHVWTKIVIKDLIKRGLK